MIAAYLLFIIGAAVVYLLSARMTRATRLIIAFAVFVVPAVALTAWIVSVGDRPPSDAVTVRSSN